MNELFFKLVRSGLYGTKINASDLPDHIDWQKIDALAKKQTLQGVVADAVMRLPDYAKVPIDVKNQMLAAAGKIAQSHTFLDHKLSQVVKLYRSEGINTVLLKGQGVARSYRNPLIRQCGDIDLYIGKKNYDKACRLAQEKLESHDGKTSESEKHYHFNMGQATVELHRLAAMLSFPIGRREFQKWLESELEDESKQRRIDIDGAEVRLPSPLFDAFFIFYHAWNHLMYGGIGLRQLCDWAMILDKYHAEIDADSLCRVLRRFKLLKPWQIMGNIVVDYLGLPAEKMPFYNPSLKKLGKKVLDLIFEGGNFGFYSKGYIYNSMQVPLLRRKWRTLRKVTQSYLKLAPIFPVQTTFNYITCVPMGGLRAIGQFIQGKK